MNSEQTLHAVRERFRRDLARLSFNGAVVTGGLGLVSIDLAKAKMMVRRLQSDSKPFCYINLPTMSPGQQCMEALERVLKHPKLKGCGLDILNDITATLWAYINIRLSKTPIQLDSITTLA